MLGDRPKMTLVRRPPRSVAAVRRMWRFYGAALLAVGAVMVLTALSVFLTEGSQIRVIAIASSERCHPQYDLATHMGETRCDADVRFVTRTGQVINATVTDAFPGEFRHVSGQPTTIQLRYDASDPTRPDKQSNYMSLGDFLLVLGLGVLALSFGGLWLARADRYAQRAVSRVPAGSLT
jgi:hypothetical protein